MGDSYKNTEHDEARVILIEFLYLSKERYQLNAAQAAEEVFKNFKINNVTPACIDAIKTCLSDDTFFEQESLSLWDKGETKKYLESFMKHYQARLASLQ